MKRLSLHLLFIALFSFFCISAHADDYTASVSSQLSMNPVPQDVSMIFLGNIFGTVDGVIASSGSQIIGQMFGVFNAAVLSLGGILLLFTLLVSTTNTAQQGTFLGQKWSSIYVPLRSLVGVGLILPKASGYCTIQIFMMWVVVQGIGAADSVWGSALSYLNSGGVIVKRQIDPNTSSNADDGSVMNASMGILAGQLCMLSLEYQYNQARDLENDLASANPPGGNCYLNKDKTDSTWYYFCNNSVPSFFDSVNITQDANLSASANSTLTQDMPSFKQENPYNALNGVCGQITWKTYNPPSQTSSGVSDQEQQSLVNTRTIAVSHIFETLKFVSNAMFGNARAFNTAVDCSNNQCLDQDSVYAFGEPMTMNKSTTCSGRRTEGVTYSSADACVKWGSETEGQVLLAGTELQQAVAAYNGIMTQALASSSLNSGSSQKSYAAIRSFISEANSKGWIMAGAYFFKLAILNNYVVAETSNNLTDSGSGLSVNSGSVGISGGTWSMRSIKSALQSDPGKYTCPYTSNENSPFCALTQNSFDPIVTLISGTLDTTIPTYTDASPAGTANNAFIYMQNANALVLPTQTTALDAGFKTWSLSFNPDTAVPQLGRQSTSGGKWDIPGKAITLIWNEMLRPLWNMLLELLMPPILQLFSLILTPMIGMTASIFNNALDAMRIEGTNPIIAIANMGTRYIDGIGNSWLAIVIGATPALLFPPAYALLMIMMPVIFSWMGVMLTVGFGAAYFVPFYPLLVFSFAGIGWMISVIEAMVAAPIVGLGVIRAQGHDIFGKSEQSLMLIFGLFLRPSLMILGYIFGIILSYVGTWYMNLGYNQVVPMFRGLTELTGNNITPSILTSSQLDVNSNSATSQMWGFWSGIFLFYFTILLYTATYIAIAQQAFDLIYYLPDKVLRWLSGGMAEQLGEGAAKGKIREVQQKADQTAEAQSAAMAKVQSGLISAASPDLNKQREEKQEEDESDSEAEGGEGEGAAK